METPGRWAKLNDVPEETELTEGMDFRLPKYRREVFLRFYEFHIKYCAHPGAVYYIIPHLRDYFGWSDEDAYWWCFLNGNTQHAITSTVLWRRFPSVALAEPTLVKEFLDQNWAKLEFDTDRRYWKVKLPEAVDAYRKNLNGATQAEYFGKLASKQSENENFTNVWKNVRKDFYGFGRLSAWSYLEYLRIIGLPIDPGSLFLEDISGSKSHRNGLCKVLGRDDLDWHDSNPAFDGKYPKPILNWLHEESLQLLDDARSRIQNRDAGFFTMESAFCTYKSWHRPNRRYPNVYNDMFHDRIRRAEPNWGSETEAFWLMRKSFLPKYLRLEHNANDEGLKPKKQNWYRTTGQVIMMDLDWSCFKNDYDHNILTYDNG